MEMLETTPSALLEDILDEGSTGKEIAEAVAERAEELRELQDTVATQLQDVLGQEPHGAVLPELMEQIETLEAQGETIGDIVGDKQTDDLEDGTAGIAYQGQEGSSVIDVGAAIGVDGTIDEEMLRDGVDHEGEHEKQSAEWNADVVDIGNGQTLTRHEVSETGAMSVQQSIDWVSGDYKRIYGKVTWLISAEEAKEVARSGDLLGLGQKIRSKDTASTTLAA